MVFSRIDHKIEYRDMQDVHESDWNHLSAVYKIEIEDKSVVVVLGKANFEIDKVIYFRIYLLSLDNMIEGQIGVFEISNYGGDDEEDRKDILQQLYDSDKDPNIHVFEEPLLYYFGKHLVERTASTSEAYLLAFNESVEKKAEEESATAATAAGENKEPVECKVVCDGDDDDTNKSTTPAAATAKSNVVFFLDRHAERDKLPGEGVHEKIRRDQMLDFRELISKYTKQKYNWRQMLHDTYDDEQHQKLEIDELRWKSVVHYVEGAKFQREHPDTYRRFSLSCETSNIAKYVDLAVSAGSASGVHEYSDSKKENICLRSADVAVDREYNPVEAREKALFAKFNQNPVLKDVLLKTGDATLVVRKQTSNGGGGGGGGSDSMEEDHILMNLRSKLSGSK